MANRKNTRRISHVKRTTRRDGRRTAAEQIRRGDYDNMASGERMVRTTPTVWGERDNTAAPTSTVTPAEYDNAAGTGSSPWEV